MTCSSCLFSDLERVNTKIQDIPQSQTAAIPQHQQEEKERQTNMRKNEQCTRRTKTGQQNQTNTETRTRGYKTFFMLNSVEHEILNAHKYKKNQEIQLFSDSDRQRMLFFLLINVKMPTIVGILTFMSRKNFMLN